MKSATRFSSLICLACFLGACHRPTQIRGVYVNERGKGTLFPCDDPAKSLRVDDSVVAARYERMRGSGWPPAYVELRGVEGHAGSIYGGPRYFLVQEILALRERREGECPKVAHPVSTVFPE